MCLLTPWNVLVIMQRKPLNECLLTPWNVLKAFLESKLQVATMEEMVGNGSPSMETELLMGKYVSSSLYLPIFEFGFSIALAKLFIGQHELYRYETELNFASKHISGEEKTVSCSKCKFVWRCIMSHHSALRVWNKPGRKSNLLTHAEECYEDVEGRLSGKEWRTNLVSDSKKIQNNIDMKWDFARRRLLRRLLIDIVDRYCLTNGMPGNLHVTILKV